MYGAHNTETRLASTTADNLAWDRYTRGISAHSPEVLSALSRITFTKQEVFQPLHTALDMLSSEITQAAGTVIVVTGRSRRLAAENYAPELAKIVAEKGFHAGSSVSKTLGNVGAAVVADGSAASLLVVQATTSSN